MKKWIVLFWGVLFILSNTQVVCASEWGKKKKQGEKSIVTQEKKSKYDKLLKKAGVQTVSGKFITLHKEGNKVYVEFPLKYMGRELLIASTVSATSVPSVATVGMKPVEPMHVKLVMQDSLVYMETINTAVTYDAGDENMQHAKELNYIDQRIRKYPVKVYNNDSTAVVLDMSDVFLDEIEELAAVPSSYRGLIEISSSIIHDMSSVEQMKAFDDNVSVMAALSYKYKVKAFIFLLAQGVVSTKATRTILLLPEDKMKPRISDSRVGVFFTYKNHLSNQEDGIQGYTFANRWRLEPKDMAAYNRGESVEPIKPIVFYVDNTFPESWKTPLKTGILRWNSAFEKIGFKNAIQVKDFPKNDPDFDPDNLKYNCIRFVPYHIGNAMGPSWVDPTTGEILNASVIVWSDIIKLINNWRFVQTAQIDPRVRAKKMPDNIVEESIAYVIAHEVGHTLGLMHNMAGSNAYPVDSLRSASFTQKYGTTPSIMDYARFNYVAQPGDKGIKLTPPNIGPYDDFVIEWLYKPVAGNLSVADEAKVLESWVDEKSGDPIYRYGVQQIWSRYDPSAIEEDLGDDPIKAGAYGIKNLQYILKNLNNWITDDASLAHRSDLYVEIGNQYARYLINAMYNIGGIYLTQVKDGCPGKRYQSVPKEKQKESLMWIMKELRNSDWLNNPEIAGKLGPHVEFSAVINAALMERLMRQINNVILSAHLSENPYSLNEYFDDLYNTIWESTIKGRKLTLGDKILQKVSLAEVQKIYKAAKDGMLLSVNGESMKIRAGVPSVEEIYLYGLDESGLVDTYYDQLKNIEEEYGRGVIAGNSTNFGTPGMRAFQQEVRVNVIDESLAGYINMALKVKKLIMSKMSTANTQDRIYYQSILALLTALEQ